MKTLIHYPDGNGAKTLTDNEDGTFTYKTGRGSGVKWEHQLDPSDLIEALDKYISDYMTQYPFGKT